MRDGGQKKVQVVNIEKQELKEGQKKKAVHFSVEDNRVQGLFLDEEGNLILVSGGLNEFYFIFNGYYLAGPGPSKGSMRFVLKSLQMQVQEQKVLVSYTGTGKDTGDFKVAGSMEQPEKDTGG